MYCLLREIDMFAFQNLLWQEAGDGETHRAFQNEVEHESVSMYSACYKWGNLVFSPGHLCRALRWRHNFNRHKVMDFGGNYCTVGRAFYWHLQWAKSPVIA